MYRLLPLLNVNEELFTPNDALTTATELTINEPVIDWLPLNWFEAVVANEPVFPFTLALNVLIDAVKVLIELLNVCELVANVLNIEELKNGVTTAKEEVVANPNTDICVLPLINPAGNWADEL